MKTVREQLFYSSEEIGQSDYRLRLAVGADGGEHGGVGRLEEVGVAGRDVEFLGHRLSKVAEVGNIPHSVGLAYRWNFEPTLPATVLR